jgi:hypothetical protein
MAEAFFGMTMGDSFLPSLCGLAGCIADVLFGGFFIENHAE